MHATQETKPVTQETKPVLPRPIRGRDRPARPFRCLDPQYRRELVRVYLANVEGIARRFLEEKRGRLQLMQAEPGFPLFWGGLADGRKAALTTERADVLLKVGCEAAAQGEGGCAGPSGNAGGKDQHDSKPAGRRSTTSKQSPRNWSSASLTTH